MSTAKVIISTAIPSVQGQQHILPHRHGMLHQRGWQVCSYSSAHFCDEEIMEFWTKVSSYFVVHPNYTLYIAPFHRERKHTMLCWDSWEVRLIVHTWLYKFCNIPGKLSVNVPVLREAASLEHMLIHVGLSSHPSPSVWIGYFNTGNNRIFLEHFKMHMCLNLLTIKWILILGDFRHSLDNYNKQWGLRLMIKSTF